MPIERSAGTVIFRKDDGKILFLLLHYPSGSRSQGKDYWDLPKGHIEEGETLEATALREAAEETGLKDIRIISGFKETIKYFFKWEEKNVLKFVTFFAAQTQEKDVKISEEHIGYQWADFKEAISQLGYKNAKEILKKTNDFLSAKGI